MGQQTWIATVDDVVVTKLQWAEYAGREKDISDVRNVMAVQHEHLDWPYVEYWCGVHVYLSKTGRTADAIGPITPTQARSASD